MGLFDKFRTPKWKHEDAKVRLEAVKELDDQEILAEIAKNDSDKDVRKEAVKKISNESVLADIAENDSDKDVREEAVERIGDESILLNLAQNEGNWDARIKLTKLHPELDIDYNDLKNMDDNELINVIKNNPQNNIRVSAIEKLTNEDNLIYLVENYSNDFIIAAAIKNPNLKNTEVLNNICESIDLSDDTYSIYSSLIKNPNFKNQNALKNFADYTLNNHDCAEAVRKITDEEMLIDFALNYNKGDFPWIVRGAAAANPNLKDENILNRLAYGAGDYNGNGEHVILCTFSNPNIDQKVLENIAKDTSAKGRYGAIENMTNKNALIELINTPIENDSLKYISEEAQKRLNELQDDGENK